MEASAFPISGEEQALEKRPKDKRPRGPLDGGSKWARWALRYSVLFYLAALLIIPVIMIFIRTFEDGFIESFEAVTSEAGLHALKLTIITVLIAVMAPRQASRVGASKSGPTDCASAQSRAVASMS